MQWDQMRLPCVIKAQASHILANYVNCPIVNGGMEVMHIRHKHYLIFLRLAPFGDVKGKKVVIAGDIKIHVSQTAI